MSRSIFRTPLQRPRGLLQVVVVRSLFPESTSDPSQKWGQRPILGSPHVLSMVRRRLQANRQTILIAIGLDLQTSALWRILHSPN